MTKRKVSTAKIRAEMTAAKRKARAFYDIAFMNCVAVAAVLMICDSVAAQDEHLNKIAKAARDTPIAGYTRTNADCDGVDPPTLYLDEPPEHGVVCWRSGDIRMSAVVVGNHSHCMGRIARGVAVRYLSRRDYAGPDDFRYIVHFPQMDHSVGVTVTVRPSGPGLSKMQTLDVDTMEPERPQSPGPMPRCVLLMS